MEDQNKKIRKELKRLVTPYQNKKVPIYNWYNYKHSFSRDLVVKLIKKFQLEKNAKILDPFCGTGTTLLAAKELGIPVSGIDILPLSVFISNAKLQKYDQKHIKKAITEIEKLLKKNAIEITKKYHIYNQNQILKKFFREDVLNNLIFIKKWIEDKKDKQIKYFFLTALLSILEEVSYTRKDGAFLRIIKNKKIADVKTVYLSKLWKMYSEIDLLNMLPETEAQAFIGDARKISFRSGEFTIVITSPPYPNRHDYTRVYLLELLIGFTSDYEDIKKMRYFSMRSHVEAREKYSVDRDYVVPKILRDVFKKLENAYLPNPRVIDMLKGYFEDMHLVLKELHRVVSKDGKVIFVIGDVRYGGIRVPVSNALIEISSNIGLEFLEKITARVRGNSPQQMKKYGKEPLEENILVWRRK